jgi:hypothetical protein
MMRRGIKGVKKCEDHCALAELLAMEFPGSDPKVYGFHIRVDLEWYRNSDVIMSFIGNFDTGCYPSLEK